MISGDDDGDGTPDHLDNDDDGDGIPDEDEGNHYHLIGYLTLSFVEKGAISVCFEFRAGVNNGWLLPEQWVVGSGQLATGCKKWAIFFSESISNTYPNPKSIPNTVPNPNLTSTLPLTLNLTSFTPHPALPTFHSPLPACTVVTNCSGIATVTVKESKNKGSH